MSNQAPLNRREWLKATGLTVAGAVLAPKLQASTAPEAAIQSTEVRIVPPEPPVAASRGEREYVLGFETYPPV